ncbi:5642_t:CDS:2, partial [Gigaspora rosea]
CFEKSRELFSKEDKEIVSLLETQNSFILQKNKVVTNFLGITNPGAVHIIRNTIEIQSVKIYGFSKILLPWFLRRIIKEKKLSPYLEQDLIYLMGNLEVEHILEPQEANKQLAIVLSELDTTDYGNSELVDQIESFIQVLKKNKMIKEKEEVTKPEEVKQNKLANEKKSKVLLKDKKNNKRESEQKEKTKKLNIKSLKV